MKSKVLKKSVIFLLLCSLLLSALQSAITVFASTTIISVDSIKYELNQTDKTAMVINAKGGSGHVVIPTKVSGYTVTAIDYNAFEGNKLVSKVTLPPTVTGIADEAFSGCTSLQSINIPDKLTYLGAYAFYNCTDLTSIYVPGSVGTINYGAFENCFSLSRVMLGSGITCIGGNAFNSSGVSSIYIPSSVYIIENCAFYDCYYSLESYGVVYYQGTEERWNSIYIDAGSDGPNNQNEAIINARKSYNVKMTDDCFLYNYNKDSNSVNIIKYFGDKRSVSVPDTIENLPVTSISMSAFKNNSNIVDVTIPETVTTISSSCFENCQYLENVNFSIKTEKISDKAFYGCLKYKNINLPNTVTSIGKDAFTDTAFYKSDENWTDSCLYIGNYLIDAKADVLRTNVRSGTKVIANNAFDGCTNLRCVSLPRSIASIGDKAFYNASSIKYILYEGTSGDFLGIDFDPKYNGVLSSGCLRYNYTPLENGIDRILINSKLTVINYFGNDNEVVIPTSIKAIDDDAFNGCRTIQKITLYDTLESVSTAAFTGCTGIKTVYFYGSCEKWESLGIVIPSNYELIFNAGTSLDNIGYEIDEQNNSIVITSYTGSNENVYIPASYMGYPVSLIAENAFAENSALKTLIVDGTDLEIADNAFNGCTNLESVYLMNGVSCIWANAFEGCSSLKTLVLSESMEFIAYKAFYNCNKVEQLVYSGSEDSWSTFKEEIDRGNDSILAVSPTFGKWQDGVFLYSDGSVADASLEVTRGRTTEIYGSRNGESDVIQITDATEKATLLIFLSESSYDKVVNVYSLNNGIPTLCEYTKIGNYIIITKEGNNTFAVCNMIGTPGDVNNDTSLNSLDSNLLKRYLAGDYQAEKSYLCDTNSDTAVNSIDSNILRRMIAGA